METSALSPKYKRRRVIGKYKRRRIIEKYKRLIIETYVKATRVLLDLLIPAAGLGGGVWIVFYVLTRKHSDDPSVPFWMLLAGSLIFAFLPLVLHKLVTSASFSSRREPLDKL